MPFEPWQAALIGIAALALGQNDVLLASSASATSS
jgi:hypothetical protein